MADLSLTLDDSDMEVIIDISDSCEMEERSIARLAQGGCSCKHFDGGPCCKLFSVSHYQEVRDQCRELTRSELDLVVMGQLLALTHSGHMTQAKKHIQKEHTRSFTYFKHGGHTICIKIFCFCTQLGSRSSRPSRLILREMVWYLGNTALTSLVMPCVWQISSTW